MKSVARVIRTVLVALAGAALAVILGAVFPPCTVSFWRLAYADEWAGGYVGPVGVPSRESLMTAGIAAAPTAAFSFRLLYKVGNPQGKAYAIQGLRIVSWPDYCRLRDEFALSESELTMHSGCLVMPASALFVAGYIECEKYTDDAALQKASETFNAHIEKLKLEKSKANLEASVRPERSGEHER